MSLDRFFFLTFTVLQILSNTAAQISIVRNLALRPFQMAKLLNSGHRRRMVFPAWLFVFRI